MDGVLIQNILSSDKQDMYRKGLVFKALNYFAYSIIYDYVFEILLEALRLSEFVQLLLCNKLCLQHIHDL